MRVGLQSTWARQCPADAWFQSQEAGVEPANDHQGLSLAALPVCVLCESSGSGGVRTRSISRFEREWSSGCLPSHFSPPSITQGGNRTHTRSGLSRAARATLAYLGGEPAPGAGFEPNSPGSEPGVEATQLPRNQCYRTDTPFARGSGRRNRTFIRDFKDRWPTVSRSPRVSCGSRTRVIGLGSPTPRPLGQGHTTAEGEGVEPSRACASSRFERGAVADRLALPNQLQGWESNPQPSG